LHPVLRLLLPPHLSAPARRTLRLAVIGLSLGIAAPVAASVASSQWRASVALSAPAPVPARQVMVWEGVDIDGDGQPDFANPTGQAPRAHDDFGDGYFSAVRDGGRRKHEGVDYAGTPGQAVVAPLSGFVTKIGYAYADDHNLEFVEITNPALGYQARVFYVTPGVEVGDAVHLGAPIGTLDSLQDRYPGIINHVHLELMQAGRRFDAAQVIVARMETVTSGQG
jgi:murein DD-endopeptidase MepM/ murein hydrolase activator NlpD